MKLKNRMKQIVAGGLAMMLTLLCGCAAGGRQEGEMAPDQYFPYEGAEGKPDEWVTGEGETGASIVENPFISAAENPVSTFSADVDTASYAYFRKLVNSGYTASALKQYAGSALRIEEMVNYFPYSYPQPASGEVFAAGSEIGICPWNPSHLLLTVQVAAQTVEAPRANNLVFLIDVSGSMASEDKLPLLQNAFSRLTEQLTEKDTVSIVTYSGKEAVILCGCPGNQTSRILDAINNLRASGCTNGEAGMTTAYSIAADYFIEGGNNRILMASDGDLNVGISSAEDLKTFVEQKRESGIYLSVLGFGTGNYRDNNMETLADNGNGVYYYIDSETEARKVLGTELLSTLETVAGNVKFQLTFNPKTVDSYRLIGYENRVLAPEDFTDDRKDAGEVGAGQTLTVAYEISLSMGFTLSEDESEHANLFGEGEDTVASLAMRYCRPGQTESELRTYEITEKQYFANPSADFRFASCVMGATMVLRGSQYVGGISLSGILEDLQAQHLTDPYRVEFESLLRKLAKKG